MTRFLLLLILAVLPARAGIVTNGSNNGATNRLGHSVAYPVSLTCWALVGSATEAVLMGIGLRAAANDYIVINTISGSFRAQVGSGAFYYADSGVFATNTWRHVAAVFASATSRIIYVDGVARATNTTSLTPASDTATLGVAGLVIPFFGGFGGNWAGTVAEAAFWTNALTASDVAVLAAGAGPSAIPYTPLRWFRLSNATDLGGLTGSPATLVNTPVDGSHPRMYRP